MELNGMYLLVFEEKSLKLKIFCIQNSLINNKQIFLQKKKEFKQNYYIGHINISAVR